MEDCENRWECNGQFAQDAFVVAATAYKKQGIFLDIGAGVGGLKPVLNNPGFYSNTFLLEKAFDWHGLCIDYDERWCNFVKPYRKARIYCKDLMKTNINDILEQSRFPRKADYLSFDVDDAQEKVFAELDFEKYKFKIITYEHNLFQSYDNCDQNHTEEHKAKVAQRCMLDRNRWEKLGYVPLLTNVGEQLDRPVEDWYVCEELYDKIGFLGQHDVVVKSVDFVKLLQAIDQAIEG